MGYGFEDDAEDSGSEDSGLEDFSSVASSILNIAPDSDTGLTALRNTYSEQSFENQEEADSIFTTYSDNIKRKFGDTNPFDYQTTLDLAPIDFQDVEGQGDTEDDVTIDRINKWETYNIDKLDQIKDPIYIQNRKQLELGIKQAATQQRRDIYGADNYLITDVALRVAEGAIGPIASLVGADSVNTWFEENKGQKFDEDHPYWSAIASGVGSAAGAIGSGAAAVAVAPGLAVGAVGAAALGAGAYLVAAGAGSVRERVEDSLDAGASTSQAALAGGIEAVSQLGQAVVGGKIFGKVGKQLMSKASSNLGARVFASAGVAAVEEGSTEAAGQVLSNYGENVGSGRDESLLRGVAEAGVAGFIVGGAAAGGGTAIENRKNNNSKVDNKSEDVEIDETPPLIKEFQDLVKEESALTTTDESGDIIPIPGKEAELKEVQKKIDANMAQSKEQTKPSDVNIPIDNEEALIAPLSQVIENIDGTPPPPPEIVTEQYVSDVPEDLTTAYTTDDTNISYPTDGERIYIQADDKVLKFENSSNVIPEVAQKLQKLHNKAGNDGTPIIIVNDNGKFYIESEFVGDDFEVTKTKTGKRRVVVPVTNEAQGNHPIFANSISTAKGVRSVVPGLVGPVPTTGVSDVGAAHISSLGYEERKTAKKLREKYGPEESEARGMSVESFIENEDGTITSKTIPLWNYLPRTNRNGYEKASQILSSEGYVKSIATLTGKESWTADESNLAQLINANVLESMVTAENSGDMELAKRMYDLHIDTDLLKSTIYSSFGQGLQTAQAEPGGVKKISEIKVGLAKEADIEISKELGTTIPTLEQEAKKSAEIVQAAEAELTTTVNTELTGLNPTQNEHLKKVRTDEQRAKEKLARARKILQDKIDSFDIKDQKRIIDVHNVIDQLPESAVDQRRKAHKAVFDIMSKYSKTPQQLDRLHTYWRDNVLSGIDTEIRNFLGNTLSTVSTVGSLAVTGVVSDVARTASGGKINYNAHTGDFTQYVSGWVRGVSESTVEAKEIIKGNRRGRMTYDTKGHDLETARPLLSGKGVLGTTANIIRSPAEVMRRVMSVFDTLAFRGAQGGQMQLATYLAAVKEGVAPADIKNTVQEKMFRTGERFEDLKTASDEHALLLESIGIKQSDAEKQLALYTTMESQLSERVRNISNRHADKAIFTKDLSGPFGAVVQGINKMGEKFTVPLPGLKHPVKPLKYVFPFLRTAANIADMWTEHTPLGAIKGTWGIKQLQSQADLEGVNIDYALEQREIIGRALIGSTVMAGIIGVALAYKDEEDPWFEITGAIPRGKMKEWEERGKKPYSIRIGNTVIPTQGTPLAFATAIAGGVVESVKAGETDISALMSNAAFASFGAVANLSFLKQISDTFDTITKEPSSSTSEASKIKKENWSLGMKANAISGFIPSSGLLKTVGRWMEASPTETYNNFSAKVLGSMPFAREAGIGKPRLNTFGEAIEKDLWERTALKDFWSSTTTDKNFLWLTQSGHSISDPGPVMELSTDMKKYYGAVQMAAQGYADILTVDQSRAALEIAGPQIKVLVEQMRDDPRFAYKSEASQKFINKKVNEIRAQAKLQVLGRN